MKKKYLRPVPKTVNETDETKAPDAKAPRKLSLKKIVVILAVFLVVAVAVTVPVCVFFVNIPVAPAFESFDQDSSYTTTIKWKRVAAARSYDLEYRFADPDDTYVASTKVSTPNNSFTLPRRAGTLYVRVRADKSGRKGKYSDWIKMDIEAWTLAAPTVTIGSSDLLVSWTPVNFRYFNDYSNVAPAYVYDIGWTLPGGKTEWSRHDFWTLAPQVDISTAVFTHSDFEIYLDYYAGQAEWPGDLTLYVQAAALNKSRYDINLNSEYVAGDPAYIALSEVYSARGEYGQAQLVVTKDVFDELPKEFFDVLLKSKGWTKK